MMLYISVRDHAKELKFSNYVHLSAINKMFQYCYAWVILWGVGEVIIFEHGCYISALAHTRMLILSIYVLLECMNTTYQLTCGELMPYTWRIPLANVYHVPGLCLLGIGGAPYISHKIMAQKPNFLLWIKPPADGASYARRFPRPRPL